MEIIVNYCEKCQKISHYHLWKIKYMNACRISNCNAFCKELIIHGLEDVYVVSKLTNTTDCQILDTIEKKLREKLFSEVNKINKSLDRLLSISDDLQLGILSKDLKNLMMKVTST